MCADNFDQFLSALHVARSVFTCTLCALKLGFAGRLKNLFEPTSGKYFRENCHEIEVLKLPAKISCHAWDDDQPYTFLVAYLPAHRALKFAG